MANQRISHAAVLGTLIAVFLVGACSKSSTPENESKARPADTQAAAIDPCGGLTVAQAAVILKIPVADVVGPHTSKAFSCEYHSKADFYSRITFNVYPEASAAVAAQKLQSTREGLAFLSPIKPVPNLGDEAYRAPDPRAGRLLMRKGSIWLDVVTPGDEASQLQIAQIVVKHLP